MTKNTAVLPITISDSSKGRAKQNIKIWSMIILIVQNTALVLMMRASRTGGGDMYSTTSCVFFMEVLKILMSLAIIFYQKEFSTIAFFGTIHSAIMGSPADTMKMMIPATIYAIQNNLLFIALSNLNATTYQVTYQLKILTTAICSVFMLRKQLQRNQWMALLLLMVGVSLVQLDIQAQKLPAPIKSDSSVEAVVDTTTSGSDPIKGLGAVILACFSSGFAGVYFEKVVKSAESNIWIRNIQLGIFGTLFSFLAMLVQDGSMIYEKGILFGYTWLVIGIVFMQAAGGLLVAVVVKYADNILKGFATSLSIVLSAIMQVGFMHEEISPSTQFIGGTVVVLFSVYLYSLPVKK